MLSLDQLSQGAVDIAGEVPDAAISFVDVRPVLDDSQMAPE